MIRLQYQYQENMNVDLIVLAETMLQPTGNTPANNTLFRRQISNLSRLGWCFDALNRSEKFLFVYSANMTKLIEERKFYIMPEKEKRLEKLNQRCEVFVQIMFAIANQLQQRLIIDSATRNTMIDLIGVILKNIFEFTKQQPYLQRIIGYFIPRYKLETILIQENVIFNIQMRDLDWNSLEDYCKIVKIFISLLNYVTQQMFSKDYYKYRSLISIFKANYLEYLLKFGVEHLQRLLQAGPIYRAEISLTLELLSKIFTYPFGLPVQSLQNMDNEMIDQYTSYDCDINFPKYFLPVICDQQFIRSLLQYFLLVINNTVEYYQSSCELVNLLKIIGRAHRISPFVLNNHEQYKSTVFSRGFIIIQTIISRFKFFDQQYLLVILDNVYNFFAMNDKYVRQNKINNIFDVMAFFKIVISRSKITVCQGANNPVSKIIDIISKQQFRQCYHGILQYRQKYQIQCQQILQCLYARILSDEAEQIMGLQNFQQRLQIQNFKQFYSSINILFKMNIDDNFSFFEKIFIENASKYSKIMWLHLCSQVLIKNLVSSQRLIKIILKYYNLAFNLASIASLRFIRVLTQQILIEMSGGCSTSDLWKLLSEQTQVVFKQFMMSIIRQCIYGISSLNNQIALYCLQFFKVIYTSLKDNKIYFQEYSQQVDHLLIQSQNNYFKSQDLYKRTRFSYIVSIIWLDQHCVGKVFDHYNRIKQGLNLNEKQSIMIYLFDLAGFIQPIKQQEPLQAIATLCLNDLIAIFYVCLDGSIMMEYLNDFHFVDVICKLIHSLTSNLQQKLNYDKHNLFPQEIYIACSPYVAKLMRLNIEIPKFLAQILTNIAKINLFNNFIDFSRLAERMKEQNCDKRDELIKFYFQNISKVEQLGWMYGLIQSNVDYMVYWWTQTMFRKEHPDINLWLVLQSRFWKYSSEKVKLLKLIFQIAQYDSSYWDISQFTTAQSFADSFDNTRDIIGEFNGQEQIIQYYGEVRQDEQQFPNN